MFKYPIHNRRIIEEIELLIKNKTIENKQIEYKSQLPAGDDKSIINCLLKPVCSFANSNDGFIIYGIKEKDKTPSDIVGVAIDCIDDTKLRIENLIRDNTEDKISGTDIAVHLHDATNKYIVIIKVKKSWYGPHRETKNNRFYGRNSAGSYIMDLAQIRNSINLSENLLSNVGKFKTGRLIDIENRETITPMVGGAVMVLHVVSLPAYMAGEKCDMAQLQIMDDIFTPKNIHLSGWNRRIVLEGLLGVNPISRSSDLAPTL